MLFNRFFPSTVSGFHKRYSDVLARAAATGATRPTGNGNKVLNKAFIDALINSGNINELDAFWMLANDGSKEFANINWITPSAHTITLVNSPTWTTKIGYENNASSTGYLNCNYAPATQGVKYTLNSSSIGGYVKGTTTLAVGVTSVIAALMSSSNHIFLGRNGSNNSRIAVRLNSSPTDTQYGSQDQYAANTLYSGTRVDNTTVQSYLNGVLSDTQVLASTSIPGGNVYGLIRNNGGSQAFPLPMGVQISCIYFGSKNVNHLAINNAVNYVLANL